jgi:hypothetical protein
MDNWGEDIDTLSQRFTAMQDANASSIAAQAYHRMVQEKPLDLVTKVLIEGLFWSGHIPAACYRRYC